MRDQKVETPAMAEPAMAEPQSQSVVTKRRGPRSRHLSSPASGRSRNTE
jgi:hypothetical protein